LTTGPLGSGSEHFKAYDFETVVLQSILAHEKPSGWKPTDPFAMKVGDVVGLECDFGAIRQDVVVTAKTLQPASAWTKIKGCKVKAEKLNSTNGQTWKITHFESVI